MEAHHVGAMATEMDERSMITGRVTTAKTMKTRSLLVEVRRRMRVMMLILSCLVSVGHLKKAHLMWCS